ncbi:hypothetical protein B7Z17_01110 [Candidatus Saccharibacteria bacterium 32-49-10]|nr:MAG: hypothetical protein B7Z17_01110 [Candidatus Saccharibacteria bacterium 32-49-10]
MDKTLELIIIALLLGIMAEIYILTKPKKRYDTKQISMLVDTSVLMDGRVIDLAKTGFLLGQVIVPKSVLAELQLLADGSDHAKRERARLGMDVVKQLQDTLGTSFTLLQDGDRTRNGVDEQLITLAKQTDSAILTLDYNLNKVAQVEGVQVLNINELAKSLRMAHLPGDVLNIELTQKGQGPDQAVGYLTDGTMVVVEQGKRFIGKSREVEIIRSLQTDAGKMMFAKLTQQDVSVAQPQKQPAPAPKQPSGGRKPRPVAASQQRADARTKQIGEDTASKSQQQKRQRPKTSAQREAELIRLVNGQE